VEFLTDPLRPRALALLKATVGLVGVAFVCVLTYYGFGQAQLQFAKGDISPTLHIPILWYWIPLLLGMTVSAIACLAQTIRHVLSAVSRETPRSAESGPA
jgi:TRAP-type C4-dicarboxylate transport system permease small subunit